MSIYQKILEAQKATGWVPKNGRNDFHRYDYAMEADILTVVKSAALEAGLIILTSTTSEIGTYTIEKLPSREGYAQGAEVVRWAKVVLSYQVIDAETGEKIEGTFDGYAEDKTDKAIYKAMTGANKYFLMKFFGVATGDDPEKEESPAPTPIKKNQPVSTVKAAPSADVTKNKQAILKIMIHNGMKLDDVLGVCGLKELGYTSIEGMTDPGLLDKAYCALDFHVKEVMKG